MNALIKIANQQYQGFYVNIIVHTYYLFIDSEVRDVANVKKIYSKALLLLTVINL